MRKRTSKPYGKPMLLIFVLVALLVITIAANIFKNNPVSLLSIPKRSVIKTDLAASQNFSYLNGQNLYAYNGMAFYKVDTSNNKLTVLSSGQRLPIPDKVYWANSQGALMSFRASFGQTQVERALRASGQLFDANAGTYPWYIDFSSGRISQVSSKPLGKVTYSENNKTKGFYYTSNEPDTSDNPSKTALYFYDINGKRNNLLSEDLKVSNVTAIQNCIDATRLCIIGRDKYDASSSQKLYSFDGGKQAKRLFNSKGTLQPTSNKDLYLSIVVKTEPADKDDSKEPDDSDINEDEAYIYDVASRTSRKLDFTLSSSQVATDLSNPKQAYIIGNPANNAKQATYRMMSASGGGMIHSKLSDLQYADGKPYTGIVNGLSGPGNSTTALLDTTDGGQVLFSSNMSTSPLVAELPSKAGAAIGKCISNTGGRRYDYLGSMRTFTISFNDDDSFASNINSFSKCIIESDRQLLIGYNYIFQTIDIETGRITSD